MLIERRQRNINQQSRCNGHERLIQLALKRLTPNGGVQKIMTLQNQVLNEHLLSNSQQLTPILTHSNVPKAFIVNRTVKSIERKHQKSFLQLVYCYFFSSSAIRWRPTVHWVYCQPLTHLPPSAPVNWVSIGSGNGLSPVRRQTITWTNAGLLSIGLLGKISVKFESEFYHFHPRKCIWNCCLSKFCLGEVS